LLFRKKIASIQGFSKYKELPPIKSGHDVSFDEICSGPRILPNNKLNAMRFVFKQHQSRSKTPPLDLRPRMHRRKSENMDNTLIPVWNPGRTTVSSNKHINPDISEAAKVNKY
jgi:hypothetical protein